MVMDPTGSLPLAGVAKVALVARLLGWLGAAEAVLNRVMVGPSRSPIIKEPRFRLMATAHTVFLQSVLAAKVALAVQRLASLPVAVAMVAVVETGRLSQ